MERAFALDSSDSRILMELDQLRKRMQIDHETRFNYLSEYRSLVDQRDDLYLEMVTLLNQLGRYEEAKVMLDARKFHPWEGGEGKVPAQYQIARVALAEKALAAKKIDTAMTLLNECLEVSMKLL